MKLTLAIKMIKNTTPCLLDTLTSYTYYDIPIDQKRFTYSDKCRKMRESTGLAARDKCISESNEGHNCSNLFNNVLPISLYTILSIVAGISRSNIK